MVAVAYAGVFKQSTLHGYDVFITDARAAESGSGRTKKIEAADVHIVSQAHAAVEIITVAYLTVRGKITTGIDDIRFTQHTVERYIAPWADKVNKYSFTRFNIAKYSLAKVRPSNANNKTISWGSGVTVKIT